MLIPLEQRVASLEKMVARLTGKTETWCMARDIMKATGWNKERLRRARVNGEVRFTNKKNGNGQMVRRYLLESVSSIHLIK
jgi:hypothetical protein